MNRFNSERRGVLVNATACLADNLTFLASCVADGLQQAVHDDIVRWMMGASRATTKTVNGSLYWWNWN